jgi:protein-disulfide isomerase
MSVSRTRLETVANLVLIAAAISLLIVFLVREFASSGSSASRGGALPPGPIAIMPAEGMGAATAPVVVLEFSDFECPFCRRFVAGAYESLRRDYVDKGKVRLVFRHFPLPRLHPNAMGAAHAAICGSRQGAFWPMHDFIFRDASSLDAETLSAGADAIGLDGRAFRECLAGGVPEEIDRDVKLARELGVTGTPTFFIGRIEQNGMARVIQRFAGAGSIEEFARTINALLAGKP